MMHEICIIVLLVIGFFKYMCKHNCFTIHIAYISILKVLVHQDVSFQCFLNAEKTYGACCFCVTVFRTVLY